MSDRIPEFIAALELMRKIHETKNHDYASGDNPFSNFDTAEYGLNLFTSTRDQVFVWPIFTKLARLANLLDTSSDSGKKPNHESIGDSFIDIANYILLWRADYMNRGGGIFISGNEISGNQIYDNIVINTPKESK